MDSPNYVLKANEAVLLPARKRSRGRTALRAGILAAAAAVFMGSVIFRENFFAALSWPSQIFLAVLALGAVWGGEKREWTASPMELQFYDDYLILYLPKRQYGRRYARREINKMRYEQITECTFKKRSGRIHFYGAGTSVWYRYRKDGTIPVKPDKIRHCGRGLLYFNTSLEPEIDFVREIEEHSPLRVRVEDD